MKQLKQELQSESFWRALTAEFLGTAVFVFSSVGSALCWAGLCPGTLQVALGFGLGVAAVSVFTQRVSGGQLNPAVSLALLLALRISPLRALLYMAMQALGAIAACALLYALTPPSVRGDLGLNQPSPGVTQTQALGVEIIVTFQLVLCVFAVSHKKSNFEGSAHVALGASVTLGHLVAIGFTGCSMNPARSLGPAVITTNFSHHWIFWVGPLLGGVLAAIVYNLLLMPKRIGCRDCLNMLKTDHKAELDVESKP
uniref:Aquaporin 15 n=1 Tax=Squalus acanthias TaxID=7797 RepID=A0A0A7R6D9_SQUAC|nr:aquaporin 15 [Squalus acanthias]UDD66117.1 aquaporin 15 [Squalus acanthias]